MRRFTDGGKVSPAARRRWNFDCIDIGMKVLALCVILAITGVIIIAVRTVLPEKTSKENMVRTRGQVPVQDSLESIDRGRLGTEPMLPAKAFTLHGILIDAGCQNRTALNLVRPAPPLAAEMPAQPPNAAQSQPAAQGNVSAGGVIVGRETLANERPDIIGFIGRDILTRQESPECAITSATCGYAIVTKDGRLLNLDEGGNTLASHAVMSDAQGRAMLNGRGPGFKPQVAMKGWIRGDRMIVDRIVQFGSNATPGAAPSPPLISSLGVLHHNGPTPPVSQPAH